MIIDVSRLPLVVNSLPVAGAALRIVQAGGSTLEEEQMRRAVGSPYLFTRYGEEILDLVRLMESSAAQP